VELIDEKKTEGKKSRETVPSTTERNKDDEK
jgi:hypothetical protein